MFKRMLSFLFVDKRELFPWNCLSRNSTLFSSQRIRALGLFWTNLGSGVSEETWGTFLYSMVKEKYFFYKGIFIFIKVSCRFSTFWHWCERKTTKCAFEIDFFAMCTADLTSVNGSTIQLVLRVYLFRNFCDWWNSQEWSWNLIRMTRWWFIAVIVL